MKHCLRKITELLSGAANDKGELGDQCWIRLNTLSLWSIRRIKRKCGVDGEIIEVEVWRTLLDTVNRRRKM